MTIDDNTSAPAGTVDTTSFSVSEAAGKLEGLISDDFGADQDDADGAGQGQADEPIPSYLDDEPDAGTDEVDGEQAPEDDDDDTDPENTDASGVEAQLDAVANLPDGTKVSVAELVKGYLRQSDYTKKTTDTAQISRAVIQEHQKVSQRATQLTTMLEMVEGIISNAVPAKPDPALRARDPVAYADALAAHEDASLALEKFRQDADPLKGLSEEASKEQLASHRNEQYRQLVAKDPRFSDVKHIEKFISKAMPAMGEQGFHPKEIANLLNNDHRAVPIIEGFMNWNAYLKRQSKAAEKTKGKPGPLRQRGERERTRGSRDAQKAFKANPSVNNAAKLLEDYID